MSVLGEVTCLLPLLPPCSSFFSVVFWFTLRASCPIPLHPNFLQRRTAYRFCHSFLLFFASLRAMRCALTHKTYRNMTSLTAQGSWNIYYWRLCENISPTISNSLYMLIMQGGIQQKTSGEAKALKVIEGNGVKMRKDVPADTLFPFFPRW